MLKNNISSLFLASYYEMVYNRGYAKSRSFSTILKKSQRHLKKIRFENNKMATWKMLDDVWVSFNNYLITKKVFFENILYVSEKWQVYESPIFT